MPKIVDHDKKRVELLAGCFDLWAQRGYSAITMRELGKELKVSTGTLYHYFRNKEELFVQMVRWLGERDITAATALVSQGETLQEKLGILFQFVEDETDHFQKLLLISIDYYRHKPDPTNNVLSQVIQSYRNTLLTELGIPSKGISTVILSTLFGMLLQEMMDPENVHTTDHKELLQQLAPLLSPLP